MEKFVFFTFIINWMTKKCFSTTSVEGQKDFYGSRRYFGILLCL